MLINVDAKALEIVCAAYLSQDPILCQELRNKVDIHGVNQELFNLPERVIAKIFVFRLIYGGTAYSYANDPDFMGVSTREKFWQGVIDEFYKKYQGMAKWHESLMEEATTTGQLRMPTGRFYNYSPTLRNGDLVWPRTTILNYPVQGLGADIMCIVRVDFAKRFKQSGIPGKIISTIHDSIVVDVPSKYLKQVAELFIESFNEVPRNFQLLFGKKFNLPCGCEISYGSNKKDLTTYTI